MKKKILFITDNYNPNGGGAEKVFFTLKDGIESSKNFVVKTLGFGKEEIDKKNLRVVKETNFSLTRYFWRIFLNPWKYFQIRKTIKDYNPDIIHIHNINKYTISILRAIKGYKVIYSVHDYGLVCPTLWCVHRDLTPCKDGFHFNECFSEHKRDMNIITYLILIYFFYKRKKLVKKRVNLFVSATNRLAKYIKKQGFENVEVVNYPVEFKKNIKPNWERFDGNSFLYGGQLEENKGVKILIEEFASALRENSSLRLSIAGIGSLSDSLKERVRELGIEEKIKFLGWVKILDYYQNHKCVIMPSIIQESFGLMMAESMGNYRPVIGSNRGAIPDVILDGKTGFIFDPTKKGDLKKKILEIASMDIKEMGKLGRKKILSYTSNKYISSYMKHYNSLKTKDL